MNRDRSLRKRRFAPRAEELEARLTPALTVTQVGSSLTIAATTAAQLNANHTIAP
jgi:hypothetical protein